MAEKYCWPKQFWPKNNLAQKNDFAGQVILREKKMWSKKQCDPKNNYGQQICSVKRNLERKIISPGK